MNGGKAMVVQEDIPMMELFRKSVNASREALTKVEVREELTYHYAIVRVYSKMLVTSCAIYTLLINGYPDDARAFEVPLCFTAELRKPFFCVFDCCWPVLRPLKLTPQSHLSEE